MRALHTALALALLLCTVASAQTIEWSASNSYVFQSTEPLVLAGRVTGAGGGLAGVPVYVEDPLSGQSRSLGVTDANGAFTYRYPQSIIIDPNRQLMPGGYLLYFTAGSGGSHSAVVVNVLHPAAHQATIGDPSGAGRTGPVSAPTSSALSAYFRTYDLSVVGPLRPTTQEALQAALTRGLAHLRASTTAIVETLQDNPAEVAIIAVWGLSCTAAPVLGPLPPAAALAAGACVHLSSIGMGAAYSLAIETSFRLTVENLVAAGTLSRSDADELIADYNIAELALSAANLGIGGLDNAADFTINLVDDALNRMRTQGSPTAILVDRHPDSSVAGICLATTIPAGPTTPERSVSVSLRRRLSGPAPSRAVQLSFSPNPLQPNGTPATLSARVLSGTTPVVGAQVRFDPCPGTSAQFTDQLGHVLAPPVLATTDSLGVARVLMHPLQTSGCVTATSGTASSTAAYTTSQQSVCVTTPIAQFFDRGSGTARFTVRARFSNCGADPVYGLARFTSSCGTWSVNGSATGPTATVEIDGSAGEATAILTVPSTCDAQVYATHLQSGAVSSTITVLGSASFPPRAVGSSYALPSPSGTSRLNFVAQGGLLATLNRSQTNGASASLLDSYTLSEIRRWNLVDFPNATNDWGQSPSIAMRPDNSAFAVGGWSDFAVFSTAAPFGATVTDSNGATLDAHQPKQDLDWLTGGRWIGLEDPASPTGDRLSTYQSTGAWESQPPAGALPNNFSAYGLAVHPTADRLAVSYESASPAQGRLVILSLPSLSTIADVLVRSAGGRGGVAWSHDGTRLAAADGATGVRVLSPTGAPLATWTITNGGQAGAVAWSWDDRYLAVHSSAGGTVTVFDTQTGSEVARCDTPGTDARTPKTVGWRGDSRVLFASDGQNIRIHAPFDVTPPSVVFDPPAPPSGVYLRTVMPTVTLRGVGSDETGIVPGSAQWRLNGGPWVQLNNLSQGTFEILDVPLNAGINTVDGQVTDLAGNVWQQQLLIERLLPPSLSVETVDNAAIPCGGGADIGAISAQQAGFIILRNSGGAALNLTSVSVSGSMILSSQVPASLAAGESCTLAIRPLAAVTGPATGQLLITSNSANGSSCAVSLTARANCPANWSLVGGVIAPPARWVHSMASTGIGQTVLFGGRDRGPGGEWRFLGDTWVLQGSAWSVRTTPADLLARSDHAMATGPGGTVVLFGGRGTMPPTAPAPMNDTWVWNGTLWTRYLGSGPTGRGMPAMTFSSLGGGATWVFGGYVDAAGNPDADLWKWNGSSWARITPNGLWPSARWGAAMAYDPSHNRVVLFGGLGATALRDTWLFNPETLQWSQVSLPPAETPGPRWNHVMGWDTVRGRIVISGGEGTNDQWSWDGTTWQLDAVCGPRAKFAAGADGPQGLVLFGGSSNNLGESLNNQTWRLSNGPRICLPLDRVDTCSGRSTTIAAVVADTAAIVWAKNGVPLANGLQSDGSTVIGATSSTLQLLNLRATSAGQYTCVASHGCGSTTSSPVLVSVAPACPCGRADVVGLGGAGGPDGALTADDVVAFLGAFFNGQLSIADVAGLGGSSIPDGQLTPDDIIVFLTAYFSGCG